MTLAGYPVERFTGVEHVWWFNPINHNSLRLTSTSYKWVQKHSQLKFIEVPLSHQLHLKHLLQLERLLNEPYYIKSKSICLLGESDAIMIQLHAGNLAQYLDNLQDNR